MRWAEASKPKNPFCEKKLEEKQPHHFATLGVLLLHFMLLRSSIMYLSTKLPIQHQQKYSHIVNPLSLNFVDLLTNGPTFPLIIKKCRHDQTEIVSHPFSIVNILTIAHRAWLLDQHFSSGLQLHYEHCSALCRPKRSRSESMHPRGTRRRSLNARRHVHHPAHASFRSRAAVWSGALLLKASVSMQRAGAAAS
jgi:hypothetical protein